jgi:hypothetical protein
MGGWLPNYQPPSLTIFGKMEERELNFLAIRKNGSLVKVNS